MIERFLIFLLFFGQYNAAPEWDEPGFQCLDAPDKSKAITYCDATRATNLYVNFFEEFPEVIVAAYINCKDCEDDADKPVIGEFTGSGSSSTLGAKIEKATNGKWALQITKKQDFEIESQREYNFQIFIGDDGEDHYVKFIIGDIDDNPPFITVNQRPCTIDENIFDVITQCSYDIEDVDTVTNMNELIYKITPGSEDVFFSISVTSTKVSHLITVYLRVDKPLDFETNPLHVFTLSATDGGGNTGTASVIIEVEDMPDEPPKWIDIFATKSFPENEAQEFKVLAKDGDIKINAPIKYKIDSCDAPTIEYEVELEEIDGYNYGKIQIKPIDRDILTNDLITCDITAFEIPDPTSKITATVTFIILDVNDNHPLISSNKYQFKINEAETTTLNEKFTIEDIDLGINAQYDLKLTSKDSAANFHTAFQVIPNTGYQKWDFDIVVINAQLLDFEDTKWRDFTLLLTSTDRGPGHLQDEKEINIILNNMNNKMPYFTMATYSVDILENLPANEMVVQLTAKDDDTNDSVIFDLSVESLKNSYEIDKISGLITTKRDDVFDYEKQTQVFIQVQATDQLQDGKNQLHTVTTQIIVNVLDVNDETPRLTLPTKSPEIKEHEPVNTVVTREIKAVDVDTTAQLRFTIEWDKTTASKPGTVVDQEQFEGVFEIVTLAVDGNMGNVYGELKVIDRKLLDYEVYEVIYLYITVTDLNQKINDGTDSAIMTIRIIDINDNPPIFNGDSIESKKFVEEEAKIGTFIAAITATDLDGPGNNIITYSLKPNRVEDDGLITIDPKSGALTVIGNIDADYPNPIFDLMYTVIASDGPHVTEADICIHVNDINNKFPRLRKELDKIIYVDEGTTHKSLQIIHGTDDDRDEPHNIVTYYLNVLGNTEQRSLFSVNPETGEILVNITDDKYELDRDDGPESYEIFLILRDNPGETAYKEISNVNFKLVLNDLNDNKPILQDTNPLIISENDPKNKLIANIIAIDKDKLCTPNTDITYKIRKITDKEDKEIERIFRIETSEYEKCKNHGKLFIDKTLAQKYYGNFNILIEASDAGDGPQIDTKIYPIMITPYNYKIPVIVFPAQSEKIILRTGQNPNQRLQKITSGYLQPFEANDDQGNKFRMSFKFISSSNGDENTFKIINRDDNQAELQLEKVPSDKTYNLTIEASHNESGSSGNKVEHNFMVLFVDLDALPIFPVPVAQIAFEEETDTGCQPFDPAIDSKCENIETCSFAIYYHIMSGNENDQFMVDASNKNVPQLCLKAKLDREVVAYHYLMIIATNDVKAPPIVPPSITPLNLTIEVIDINDNPPEFSSDSYSGSLTVGDIPERSIIDLEATDKDTSDEGKLVYSIDYSTMKVSDSSLDKVKDKTPFKIVNTKQIVSNFKVISSMQGYFTFTVVVEDSPPEKHQATAEVKIIIISDANRIVFTFKNDEEKVKSDKKFIEEIFSEVFAYNCTVDDTYKKVDEGSGNQLANETDVKTHFINTKDNLPVEKDVITVKSAEYATVSLLRVKFLEHGLNFSDVPTGDLEDAKNVEELLKTLLIVVSVVLGTLCIVLLLAFVLRTRTLKKRLEAMTTNVFGSTKSDLNRIGTSAPGTNKHAIEANPVWNEDLNDVNKFDSISQGSGGSDLIGIEDNPEFDYTSNIRRESVNPMFNDNFRRQSLNPMATSKQNDADLNFKPTFELDKENIMF